MSRRHVAQHLCLALLLPVACVQVEPQADFAEARRLVEETTGQSEVFDPAGPALSAAEVDAVLADGLSLEEAQRLALLNNRGLQADFQKIGVAHADWVQSRLLSNPTLDVLWRFPPDGGKSMVEAIAGMQILELWRLPVRREAARRRVESATLTIARSAGELLAAVRKSYYQAVAAEELHRVAADNVELAGRSFAAVQTLHDAGAADAFDENLAQGPSLAAQLELRTARMAAANARRDLAGRLSLEGPADDLALTDALPPAAEVDVDPEVLVQLALNARLDLRAMERGVQALEARLRFEQRKAFGDAAAGPAIERQTGGSDTLIGPSLSLTLPLFDQNQAQVARARFLLEQMVKSREAARIAVAQEVRAAADRVNSGAQNLAFYAAELLPQAERSLALARESYAAGRTPLLALIEVQRQLLTARRGHVTLRLQAASAATELERVVGAPVARAPEP